MKNKLTITVVVNNHVEKPYLLAEKGLSLFIKFNDQQFLFDTGPGEALLLNAANLNLDLANIDAIIISHGHREHTGGIKNILAFKPKKLFAHPAIFAEKFSRDSKELLFNVTCPVSKTFLEKSSTELILNKEPLQLASGMLLSGEVSPVEKNPTSHNDIFYRFDPSGLVPDTLEDEQFILIDSAKGWVVITGCNHKGVFAMLKKATELAKTDQFYMLLGGLHLQDADADTLKETASLLKSHFKYVVPMCCTGVRATCLFYKELGKKLLPLFTGDSIEV